MVQALDFSIRVVDDLVDLNVQLLVLVCQGLG